MIFRKEPRSIPVSVSQGVKEQGGKGQGSKKREAEAT